MKTVRRQQGGEADTVAIRINRSIYTCYPYVLHLKKKILLSYGRSTDGTRAKTTWSTVVWSTTEVTVRSKIDTCNCCTM